MAGFLYYFPGRTRPLALGDQAATEYGLEHLRGASVSYVNVLHGPEGTAGYCISVRPEKGGKEAKTGYYPETQHWFKVPAEKPYWIGWEKANPPGPADLARPNPIDGSLVTIDGHEWIVPAVHVTHTTLPRGFRLKSNDEPEMLICGQYESLCQRMNDWLRWAKGETDAPTYREGFSLGCDLLGVNYRLSEAECSLDCLNLVRTDTIIALVQAGLGIPQMEAEVEAKKKAFIPADGSGSTDGVAA